MSRNDEASMRVREDAIQGAIVGYLRLVAPTCRIHSVPNGAYLAGTKEERKRAAAKLKWQGLLPGVPDLIVAMPGGRILYIEVKTPKGALEPEQEAFRDWCLTHAVPWMTARSVDDVKLALTQWGIPNREAVQ